MKIKLKTLALVGAVALGAFGLARAADMMKAPAMKKDIVWPAEAMKWADGPAKGVHVAKLWGDMAAGGSYGALLKFDAGLMHPMHMHTQDLKIVVIAGTFVHHPEGGVETRLGPGSYLVQRGGQNHVSGCAEGADCEFFMSSKDKFDMNMMDAAK